MSSNRVYPLSTLLLVLVGGTLFRAPLAAAQAEAEGAEDYSAAARVPREEFDSQRSQSRVDREQADRAAAGSAGDILEQADGVVVQRTSSSSAAPIIRGLTGYRVLLLQDELRLNDSLTRPGGNALLNLIDPESIQRIEVIRGPASVLYGSDALGGVVRVVTYRTGAGGDPGAGATAYARAASAEQAVRAQGAVYGSTGPVGARVSGGGGHADLIERGGDLGEQPFTGHDDWSLAARMEAVPASGHRLSFAFQSGHLLDAPRTDVSTPEDVQTTKRLDRETAVLSYRGELSADIRLRAYAGILLRREWRERVRPDQLRNERDRVLSYQAGLDVVLAPLADASLDIGAETIVEDIGSGTETEESGVTTRDRGRYVDGSSYGSYALYALWSQGFGPDWTGLAGVRGTLVHVDAPPDPLFDAEIASERRVDDWLGGVVGSLGVRADLTAELAWTASALSGFRAPNLEDYQALGGGARGFTIPNPDLDEERSYTLETGIEFDDDVWRMGVFAFGSVLTGLIERVPTTFNGMAEIDGDRVQTPDNASRSVLLGAELGVVRRFAFGLYAGVSAFGTWGETERPDAEGNDVTEAASKVPPPIGQLQLGYERPSVPYWAQGVLTLALPQTRLSESDKEDVRICEMGPEGCDRVDGYADITLRAGLRLGQHLALAVGLENLLDNAYKTFASGAYAPGRNVLLSVRGTL